MRLRHYWKAVIVALCCSTIKSCPQGFFEASDTCLLIAQPGLSTMDEYCQSRGGTVFGRPVTENIAKILAEKMAKEAEAYMPQFAFLGMKMEAQSGGYYSSGGKWHFEGEDEEFDASDYKLWFADPNNFDCAVTGASAQFKAFPYNCQDKTSAVCQKVKEPCYDKDVMYADYRGLCLVVMREDKSYSMSNEACKDGQLVHMKTEENQNGIKMAFYNQRFAGGLYVGLQKKGKGEGNGAWEYGNGEKLKDGFEDDDKMEYECGGVRVLEDLKTLGLYTIPCDSHRLHFLCEVRTNGK